MTAAVAVNIDATVAIKAILIFLRTVILKLLNHRI